jgi:streptogramin lyase
VAVTDSEDPPATATASLTIKVTALPLAITTSTLPTAIQGTGYDQQLAAAGGVTPYIWTVSTGSLPDGLSLDPATGVISGTPTGTGNSPFTVQVTDSDNPAATASVSLAIAVIAPLTITTASLPEAEQGFPYSAQLSAAGPGYRGDHRDTHADR